MISNNPISVGSTQLYFQKIIPDEGTRNIVDTSAPVSNSASPTLLFGWLAYMIKAITGKGSWRIAPATTLEVANTHHGRTDNPHGTTCAQIGAAPSAHNHTGTYEPANANIQAHVAASAPHAGHVSHSLATAANDFLVGGGAGAFIKKTLAEVKSILGLGDAAYKNTGTVNGSVAAGDHGHANNANIGGPYAASTHNHTGTYEPANANIQSHIGASAPHAGHVNHALATAANDFLVGSGPGAFIKKTLAEVKSILGLGDAAYKDTGTANGTVATGDHGHANNANIGGPYEPANANIQAHVAASAPHAGHVNHALATAANDFLVGSGAGAFIKKTLAEVKAILGLGDAAYKNTGTASGTVAAGNHGHGNDATIGGPYLLASNAGKVSVMSENTQIAGLTGGNLFAGCRFVVVLVDSTKWVSLGGDEFYVDVNFYSASLYSVWLQVQGTTNADTYSNARLKSVSYRGANVWRVGFYLFWPGTKTVIVNAVAGA